MKTLQFPFKVLLIAFLLFPFAVQSQDVSYKFNEGVIRVDGEPWANMERRGGLTSGRTFILTTFSGELVAVAREIIYREEDVCWFRIYFPAFDEVIEYRSGATMTGRELAESYVLASVLKKGEVSEQGVRFFCMLYADDIRNYLLPFRGN